MSYLFYTIGYPGAGKTSFARNLSRWFGGPHLQADRIGLALFVVPTFSPAERAAVYQHMDNLAMSYLHKQQHVLYDGTINTAEQRQHLEQLAARCNAQAIGLWLTLPVETAKERAGKVRDVGAGRIGGRVVPPEIFDKHVAGFQTPTASEPVVQVSGTAPFAMQYMQLRTALNGHNAQNLPKLVQL